MTETTRRKIVVSDAPRSVPLGVQAQVLFGGVLSMVGWLFLGMGLLFSLIFVGNSEVLTWIDFRGERAQATGTVEGIRETSSSENDNSVLGVSYRYQVDGRDYTGESFATSVRFRAGHTVKVEYLVAEPEQSRIRGLRRRHFGGSVVFILLFPCVGLVMVVSSLPFGLRGRRLLRIGILGWGTLVSKRATATRVNKRTVYRLTFRFTDPRVAMPGGPYRGDAGEEAGKAGFKSWSTAYEVTCKTHEVERLADEAEEPLLFDPDHPERAVMLDGLPGHTRFDADGQLTTDKSPWLTLAAPVLSVLVMAVAALLIFV